MPYDMKAMLLAAGRGARMGRLTDSRPKPLLTVAGHSLIERNLSRLEAAGFRDVIINLSYLGEQIRDVLEDGARFGVKITYSQEPEPPLETAGGIVNALRLLGEGPFLLINADVVTDIDLRAFARRRRSIALVPNPPHNPSGDFGLTDQGLVTESKPHLTFSGVSVLDTDMFAGLSPGPRQLKSVLDDEIAVNALLGWRHDGFWSDVGTPERLAAADRLLSRLELKANMLDGSAQPD